MTAPAAAPSTTWTIDASHSTVEFAVKHMMISTVKGRFGDVTGTVVIPSENLASATVDVSIATASVDTQNDQRDGHLKSPDFFDAEQHPTITFVSRDIAPAGNGFAMTGSLTLHGVTRPVTLNVTDSGAGKDPWGNQRRAFEAKGKIDRRDFGLVWNQTLETGGLLVSTDVNLSFEIQLVQS
jgi:polyisoprenoid-binding protein YceI